MGLNETPSGERIHISFFGKRNAGKSSLVNAVTGQDLSLVSPTKGTTTDPVRKAMEILPLGPVVIIDTPGYDDQGELGELRVQKTRRILDETDIAVLVVDGEQGLDASDQALLTEFQEKKIPYLTVYNKADLLSSASQGEGTLWVSARTGQGITALKEGLGGLVQDAPDKRLLGDLLRPGDRVILVTPIDSAAPKGRLILPQQQVLRDVLDSRGLALVCQTEELAQALDSLVAPPALVVTDSQAFQAVAALVPPAIPLTSFSILMARYKGFLAPAVQGAAAINRLQDGDRVLIAEGCTHHRQCEDIGTVKLPRWLRQFTGKDLSIQTCSGREFPQDLSAYALVLHCGGCMLNEAELRSRRQRATEQGVPFTNYGIAIAHIHGILKRSLEIFPDLCASLESIERS